MKNINKNRIALTGGVAAAEALKQIEPDVMAVYPITPQTPIIETYAKFQANGEVKTEIIQVESEHSAISACIGSSAAGARTITATSSQGLALMNEILYVASGSRLPILMMISSRALGAPINIHGDHSDVMGARDTGWIQIFSENPQEVYDNTIMGMKLAEKTSIPTMVIMDGFNTSHSVENLEILNKKTVQKFVGRYNPKNYLLDIKNPVTFGPLALQNSYFDFKVDQEKAMQSSKKEYEKIMKEYEKISNRKQKYFEEYKTKDAENVVVLMGSAAGTAKDVVDELRSKGKKVGVLKINLFRPFPHKEVARALKNVENVAVLDRSQSVGTYPPLYMEIVNSLLQISNLAYRQAGLKSQISGYVYGLGGRDIFMKDIEKVFVDIANGKKSESIKYIGI